MLSQTYPALCVCYMLYPKSSIFHGNPRGPPPQGHSSRRNEALSMDYWTTIIPLIGGVALGGCLSTFHPFHPNPPGQPVAWVHRAVHSHWQPYRRSPKSLNGSWERWLYPALVMILAARCRNGFGIGFYTMLRWYWNFVAVDETKETKRCVLSSVFFRLHCCWLRLFVEKGNFPRVALIEKKYKFGFSSNSWSPSYQNPSAGIPGCREHTWTMWVLL